MTLPLPSRSDRLIVFTRYPRPGSTKTRLIPALGAAGAADLQRQMTEHTLRQVQQFVQLQTQQGRSLSVQIWFASTEPPSVELAQMQAWLGEDWPYRPQGTGDLGLRMATALQTAFEEGTERAVIIGTDCPELDADRLAQAFMALMTHDLVLGEATDGGYYLIGLRQEQTAYPSIPSGEPFAPWTQLFTNIAWGTSTVFQQTLEVAHSLHWSIAVLAALTDVDRPEDLAVWEAINPSGAPSDIS